MVGTVEMCLSMGQRGRAGEGRRGKGREGKGPGGKGGRLHWCVKRQRPLNTMGAPGRDVEQKGHHSETRGPLSKVCSLVSTVPRLISEFLINGYMLGERYTRAL